MIRATELTKKYNDKIVIDSFSYEFREGCCYCITGSSGCGKTTLLHMLMGLIQPDFGEVVYDKDKGNVHFGVLFQEDRLVEGINAVRNVKLVSDFEDELIRKELCRLLPEESLSKPVKELSGGMKRRAALVRAFSHGDIIILDEPFAMLDEDNVKKVTEYIKEKSAGKTVIIATHEKNGLSFCEEIKL